LGTASYQIIARQADTPAAGTVAIYLASQENDPRGPGDGERAAIMGRKKDNKDVEAAAELKDVNGDSSGATYTVRLPLGRAGCCVGRRCTTLFASCLTGY
jgi:hypothetical protein